MENGCYKLSWRERIGFSAGDLAQNLIYQTVSIWLLFYYTNVYGLKPSVSAVMFLVVRIIDVIWDPVVGAFIDKANPRWGKYRSWLIFAGIPLAAFAILCFWNGFSGSLVYAYITYVGMSMCYTLVNVPYGALNSSLTRDTEEITVLTSTRMFMANLGALIVKSLPMVIAIFAPLAADGTAITDKPEAAPAWFITMTIFGIAGLALLIFCFSQTKERVVMDEKDTKDVKVSDLWTEFFRNRPLRVIALFFITAFAMMSVGNAAGAYFMNDLEQQTPLAQEGIRWLVCVIPAILLLVAMWIISKYELEDDVIDKINMELVFLVFSLLEEILILYLLRIDIIMMLRILMRRFQII